jgi:hypothetical protein
VAGAADAGESEEAEGDKQQALQDKLFVGAESAQADVTGASIEAVVPGVGAGTSSGRCVVACLRRRRRPAGRSWRSMPAADVRAIPGATRRGAGRRSAGRGKLRHRPHDTLLTPSRTWGRK